MPKNFTIDNFRHLNSNSWLRPCPRLSVRVTTNFLLGSSIWIYPWLSSCNLFYVGMWTASLKSHYVCFVMIFSRTSRAMSGSVRYRESLASRLEIMQPSLSQVQEFLKAHPPQFTPGMQWVATHLRWRWERICSKRTCNYYMRYSKGLDTIGVSDEASGWGHEGTGTNQGSCIIYITEKPVRQHHRLSRFSDFSVLNPYTSYI